MTTQNYDAFKEPSIQSLVVRSHVKALKFISDWILVGEGNTIHCYDWKRKKLLETEVVFSQTNSVYGIRIICQTTEETIFLVFGGKTVRVFRLLKHSDSNMFSPLTPEQHFEDWVLDVRCFCTANDNSSVAVVMAHNRALFWNWKRFEVGNRYHCSEQCILYSAHVIQCHPEAVIIASGTVFKEIVIWSAQFEYDGNKKRNNPLHRLTGHQGVVFSITFNSSLQLLCSTSDDRTMRLWKFYTDKGADKLDFIPVNIWMNGSFKLHHVFYTHDSRVWTSAILQNCVVSVGEDSAICFHSLDGAFLQKEKCHKEGNIWCIDVNNDNSIAVTGGSDSGVHLWDINQVVQPLSLKTLSLSDQNDRTDFPRTVLLLLRHNRHYILVSTDKGRLLLYDLEKEKWLSDHVDNSFAAYGLPAVDPQGNVVLWGNLCGELSIFKFDGNELIHCKNQKILNTKVCGIHWMDCNSQFVLTCGCDGLMIMWHVETESEDCNLILKCSFYLPKNKYHWWSTAAVFMKAASAVIVGDRGGSIHVYDVMEKSFLPEHTIQPTVSHFSIHGRNGVTDIKENGPFLYSTGRDGKLVVYYADTLGIHRLHHKKVPNDMEWLGKIFIIEDDLILLGFHSMNFVAWSSKHECSLMKVTCGGGHRSWDFSFDSNYSSVFVAIKKKEVMVFRQDMNFQIKNSTLQFGTSGMPFRCVCYISMISDEVHGDVSVLACGGEEPSLKIIALKYDDNSPNNVVSLHSISGHLSNIRSIAKCEIPSEQSCLLLSVGGRAQMIAWKVQYQQESIHLTSSLVLLL